MKIAVTGASGQLGRLVVEEIKKKVSSEDIIALARTPEKISDLGVETRTFDYTKPESLANELRDVDRLLLISGNEIGQRAIQHANVINAAKEAGVPWVVYTSLLRADSSTISLADEHLASEAKLKESGIDHTILRNGWYTENYTGSIAGAVASGAFIGSAGEAKISSAARKDYAEAAATVIANEEHKGKVFELAGDSYYTLNELASEISKHTDKEIPYNNLPQADYAAILKQVGLPEPMANAIASWDASASQGDLYSNSSDLTDLIGRSTTPMADTVAEAMK